MYCRVAYIYTHEYTYIYERYYAPAGRFYAPDFLFNPTLRLELLSLGLHPVLHGLASLQNGETKTKKRGWPRAAAVTAPPNTPPLKCFGGAWLFMDPLSSSCFVQYYSPKS